MMQIRKSLSSGVALLGLLGCLQAHAAPFTIDNVLQKLDGKYPGLARVDDRLPDNVVAYENLRYRQSAEEPLELDIYRPRGTDRLPAVLIIHGGGWETGHRHMERPFAKRLAARGFVAVPVSYRLGPSGRFPAAVHDLKAAVRWLRANDAAYGIDPQRIAAVGGSAGGHLAALLGASNGIAQLEGDGENLSLSSAVQAVVDIDGAVSFTDARIIEQERRREGAPSRFLGGAYAERRETWYAASPLYYLGAESAPTLFINSTAPTPILPGREEMQARLLALGIDAQRVTLADTPHPFWLVHPWFEETLERTALFLQKKLL
ncbi:Acetyl esterase/lipase [Microbulbifer donghaiensis]|uniref:Acetyl esterase/lipase n=1 Tax=Microbulbifer donghaiensis TaxID=494016 RepID=A0A1M5DXJ3_9GAMM|nr:alpha/beta hydrolase [Microbulbifer donghaiensis]SHF71594.1 Acetyl esterase/lipase [Microbulbifer donghaiensis]